AGRRPGSGGWRTAGATARCRHRITTPGRRNRRRTLRLAPARRHRRRGAATRAGAVVVVAGGNRSGRRIAQAGNPAGRDRGTRCARPRTESVGRVGHHRTRPRIDHRDRTVRCAPIGIPTPEAVPAVTAVVPRVIPRVVPGIVVAPAAANRDRHAGTGIAPATRQARERIVEVGVVAAAGNDHRLLTLVTWTPYAVADHVVAELAVASHLSCNGEQLRLGVAAQVLQAQAVVVPVHPGRELAEI